MAEKRLRALIESRFDDKGTRDANKSFKDVAQSGGVAAKGLDQTERSATRLDRTIRNLVTAGFLLQVGRMLMDVARISVDASSRVEEMASKFNVVFGVSAPRATQELARFGEEVNRSVFDLQEMAASVQDTFVPLGFARDQAADMSIELVKLATDVASFNNKLDVDVMRDFQSALVGNGEAVRKYGIIITETTVKQELQKMGLDKLTGAALEQAKVQARLNLLYAGTTDAQGDAARTADSYANVSRGLEAVMLDLKVAIGDELIPELTNLKKELIPVIRLFTDWVPLIVFVNNALRDKMVTLDEINEIIDRYQKATSGSADEEKRVAIEAASADRALLQLANSHRVAAEAAQENTDAESAFKDALNELQTAIADPLGSITERFEEQQASLVEKAARLRDQLADLEGKPLTERGRAELRELQREFDNTRMAILANMEAYEQETKVALFGILQQKIARMELTEDQMKAAETMLNAVAHGWGIIGDQTFQALGAIDQALGQFAQGNVKAAQQEILNIGRAAMAVEGDYFIRFHVLVDKLGAEKAAFMRSRQGGMMADIDRMIESQFPSGTFSGLRGLGGLTAGAKEKEETKKSPIEQALELANAYASIGGIAVERLREQVIEPLKKEIEGIDKLLSPSHVDMLARERSAELEEQRARAAEKVAEAERKILEFQKAQQNLRFLEQQVRLLDLIEENKLDSKKILGGLKLGIDADMGEVLEAMTRALDELIVRTEKKLKIGSPSQIYVEYGQALPQGLAKGVEKELDMVESAVSRMTGVALPQGEVPQDTRLASHLFSGKSVSIGKVEINMPVENINDMIDWQDAARRLVSEFKHRVP